MTEKPWLRNYPESVAAEIPPLKHSSLSELFEHAVRQYPQKPAFTHKGTTYTYADWGQKSMAFANFLQCDLGIPRRQRVAIMMPNLLQYPVVLAGVLQAGLIAVNINPQCGQQALKEQLMDSESVVLVILDAFLPTLEAILAETAIRYMIVTKAGDAFSWYQSVLADGLAHRSRPDLPASGLTKVISYRKAMLNGAYYRNTVPAGKLNDTAFLHYTGGTTGFAKGVVLSHGNVLSNVEQTVVWLTQKHPEALSIRENREVVLTALPFYHAFTIMANFLVLIRLGAHNYLTADPNDKKSLIRVLKSDRFTCITGTNVLYSTLMQARGIRQVNFSALKTCLIGGAAIRKDIADDWQQLTGSSLNEAYGLAEASPAVTMNLLGNHKFNGSIGLPLPSTECEIRDRNGQAIHDEKAGELYVRGPQIMQGYWQHPVDSVRCITEGGWLKTGDIACFDKQGFLYLLGQKSDRILASGQIVYPDEIEAIISHHVDVLECGVIGVPDAGGHPANEAIKAFVVKRNPELNEESLLNFCHLNLDSHKVPKYIEFRSCLPKSTMGKVLRRKLKE